MNEVLVKTLDECIYLCDRGIQMSKKDKDSYHEYLGGDLLSVYREAADVACERFEKIKKELKELQMVERNRPLI